MSEHVDNRDVDDGLELAEEHVGQHGPEDGGEVAAHRETMVDSLEKNIVKINKCKINVDIMIGEKLSPI